MDDTRMASPVSLHELQDSRSPSPAPRFSEDRCHGAPIATPRTALRLIRLQSRSRPSAALENREVVKSLPDGLIRSPPPSPPPTAWNWDKENTLEETSPLSFPSASYHHENTQPRRLGDFDRPHVYSEAELITMQVRDILLASPAPKLCNGHTIGGSAPSLSPSPQPRSSWSGRDRCEHDDVPLHHTSLLKQRQLQRIQQLQFDHPAIYSTPQRLEGTSRGLREILNSNATSVMFTPRPPPGK